MPAILKHAGMLLALALPAAPAAAQLNPTPLEATHPNAVRAAAVVERIIAGDRAGAAEVLRREGDPAWVAGSMERQLDGPLARLGTPPGHWRIDRFEAAGMDADVIVWLTDGTASDNLAVRMQAAPPHRIVGFARLGNPGAGGGGGSPAQGAGPAAANPAAPAPLAAADQRAVVDSIARLLEAYHTAPDTGRMIADRIRQQERAGTYAPLTARDAFARSLTADLQSVNGDRHLFVVPGGAAVRRPNPGADVAAGENYGFSAEVREGNVGYVRLAGPMLPDPAALEAAAGAFRAVERADAVILDLRGVPGGSPEMVDWMVSHFVEPGTPLVRVYDRRAGTDRVRTALDCVSGPRRLEVPLYVLVDQGSFSAAEALPFILQGLGRATIVGERTRGGGRNNLVVEVGSGLSASVTFSRVTSPRTGRGWEGIGIQPDIAVPAADALGAAEQDALRRLGRSAGR